MYCCALRAPANKSHILTIYEISQHTKHILYQVDEPAPKDEDFKNILLPLLATAKQPDRIMRLRKYTDQWTCWLKLGFTIIKELETCVQALLASLFSIGAGHPEGSVWGSRSRHLFSSKTKCESPSQDRPAGHALRDSGVKSLF